MPTTPGYFRDILVANGQSDFVVAASDFMPSSGVTLFVGRKVLCRESSFGGFRFQLGVQTYDTDSELPNAPVPFTGGGTGTGYQSTVQKEQFSIDLTDANNGNIDTHTGFRLVILFSDASASTQSWGDVLLDYTLLVS